MTILSLIRPGTTAALLDEAAAIHRKNGHARLELYRWEPDRALADMPVDMVGALLVAAFGQPRWPDAEHPNRTLVLAAEAALKTNLATRSLTVWSDDHEPDEVTAALADTAEWLRKAVAP